MEPRRTLAANLTREAEAYGYTLSIWGAGALLVDAFGVPGFPGVFAYVAGALVGFATLAVIAFRGFFEPATVESADSALAASMVHVVSTTGALAAAFAVSHVVVPPELVAWVTAGFLVTVAYNLLLLVEELVAAAIRSP